MFVTALLAASLAAPVPKGLKPKTIERQLIGRWEWAGEWVEVTDRTDNAAGSPNAWYEFQVDGVITQQWGNGAGPVEGRYTLIEPEGERKEWGVRIEFPKPARSGKWDVMLVTDDRLMVVNGLRGSYDLFVRAKETPAEQPKK